jgi:hypothetical protein
VKNVSRKSEEGEAVQWDGEALTARLLQAEGWIQGAAQGDTQDFSGGPVLRAHVGTTPASYAIAYPGDYIVKLGEALFVVAEDAFDDAFDVTGDAEELSNDEEAAEPAPYEQVPTGEQPRPPEQMPMGSPEQVEATAPAPDWEALTALAEVADGENEQDAEAATETLSNELAKLGVDVDSHPADTWQEMVATTQSDYELAHEAPSEEPVVEEETA